MVSPAAMFYKMIRKADTKTSHSTLNTPHSFRCTFGLFRCSYDLYNTKERGAPIGTS